MVYFVIAANSMPHGGPREWQRGEALGDREGKTKPRRITTRLSVLSSNALWTSHTSDDGAGCCEGFSTSFFRTVNVTLSGVLGRPIHGRSAVCLSHRPTSTQAGARKMARIEKKDGSWELGNGPSTGRAGGSSFKHASPALVARRQWSPAPDDFLFCSANGRRGASTYGDRGKGHRVFHC